MGEAAGEKIAVAESDRGGAATRWGKIGRGVADDGHMMKLVILRQGQ